MRCWCIRVVPVAPPFPPFLRPIEWWPFERTTSRADPPDSAKWRNCSTSSHNTSDTPHTPLASSSQSPAPPLPLLSSTECLYVYVMQQRVVGLLLARQSVACSRLREAAAVEAHFEPTEGGGVTGGRGEEVGKGLSAALTSLVPPRPSSWVLSMAAADVGVASMGVEKVWVLPSHRRQRIGSVLLDCARWSLLYGQAIERADIAFSQPTDNGRRFAQHYTATQHILAYAI